MKNEQTPQFFSHSDDPALKKLIDGGQVTLENDIFIDCLEELCEIEHPWIKPGNPVYEHTREKFFAEWKAKGPFKNQGVWVYFPWIKALVHCPPPEVYIRLRTSRNRNLVTEEEQKVLESKLIGIGGMSVGSNILNTLVLTGTCRHFKISDPDTISVPNLNRLMAPAYRVGMNKALYFAQKSWEVDPFLTIEAFPKGLHPDDFTKFFEQPKLDLFIEEMDNPYLKVQSRKKARELGIPVIMAADNGDGVLIDVERFDLEPHRPLFNGRLKNFNLDDISEKMSFSEKLAIIATMAGLKEATPRMQDSIGEVGTVLNTWPQLGTAALMAGVALTFVARQILLGYPMPSGRYAIGLEEHLQPIFKSQRQKTWRERHTRKIMKDFSAFQTFIKKLEKI